jgi:colanic acid/amylovoran biosynthesis glycosyltransferase
MKILYLSDHTPYNNTFIRQDIELISNIHEVYYYGFLSDKTKRTSYQTKHIKYPVNTFKSRIKWRLEKINMLFNWKNRKFSKNLSQEIQKIKPDIIHCQFLYESAKYFQNSKIETPVIVNIRGYGATNKIKNIKYKNWVEQISFSNKIYPIFVCEDLKINLLKKGIKFLNEGMVLKTGVDMIKFKRTNYNKQDQTTFIQVGSFNDKKGQSFTIKAFKKLVQTTNKNVRLIFIGNGKNFERCKLLVKSLEISQYVIFKGSMNQIEIINELNKADIFVHHSVTAENGDKEGIPNSIAEAMSMEMPILSTFHSGIPEIVESGKNGFLCQEKDVDEYFIQMKESIDWNFLKENRIKIRDSFEINKHIEKLLEFYQYVYLSKNSIG